MITKSTQHVARNVDRMGITEVRVRVHLKQQQRQHTQKRFYTHRPTFSLQLMGMGTMYSHIVSTLKIRHCAISYQVIL